MNLNNTVSSRPTVAPHQTNSLSRPAQPQAANPTSARQETPSAKVDISTAARQAVARERVNAPSDKAAGSGVSTSSSVTSPTTSNASFNAVAKPSANAVSSASSAANAAGGSAQTERMAVEQSTRAQRALSMFNDNAGNSVKPTPAVRLTA